MEKYESIDKLMKYFLGGVSQGVKDAFKPWCLKHNYTIDYFNGIEEHQIHQHIEKFQQWGIETNFGEELTDPKDREAILNILKEVVSPYEFKMFERGLWGLFYHKSNVQFVFNQKGLQVPQWYLDRYVLL